MTDRQKVSFALAMNKIVQGVLDNSLDSKNASERLQKGSQWLDRISKGGTHKEASKAPSALLGPSMQEVKEVFEHWRETTKRPRAKLTKNRIVVIRSRLASFSIEQLKHITLWATQDPFYSGANPQDTRYDWPKTMFRSDDQVEKLLEKAEWCEGSSNVASLDVARKIKELEDKSDEARKEGEVEEFNRIQREIRKAKSC